MTTGPRHAPANARGGELLRLWRQRRRRSQLDLALDTGISARHLSFVETGRSQPSRRLLLALAEQLDVPLRERNALMLAAGYAPYYGESDLGSAELTSVRGALQHLLAGHEPYPAVVLDLLGDIQLRQRARHHAGRAHHRIVPARRRPYPRVHATLGTASATGMTAAEC
jgi:transcriptional regulator with XRE-family HTH domain